MNTQRLITAALVGLTLTAGIALSAGGYSNFKVVSTTTLDGAVTDPVVVTTSDGVDAVLLSASETGTCGEDPDPDREKMCICAAFVAGGGTMYFSVTCASPSCLECCSAGISELGESYF